MLSEGQKKKVMDKLKETSVNLYNAKLYNDQCRAQLEKDTENEIEKINNDVELFKVNNKNMDTNREMIDDIHKCIECGDINIAIDIFEKFRTRG